MKATAYLRVSTQEQAKDDRNGYDRQLKIIQDYATKNNIEITGIYREAWTGTEVKRPELGRMVMDILLTQDVRTILVESMDRFSRDAVKGFTLISDLLLQEIDLINCSTGESMNETLNGHPMKEIMAKFSLLIAEAEKKMISYRLSQGRQTATAKAGGRYVAGVQPMYTEKQRDRLRALKAKGKTFKEIADYLNKRGEKTATGIEWDGNRVAAVIFKAFPKRLPGEGEEP